MNSVTITPENHLAQKTLEIKSANKVPRIIETPDLPHTESLINPRKGILNNKSEIDKRT